MAGLPDPPSSAGEHPVISASSNCLPRTFRCLVISFTIAGQRFRAVRRSIFGAVVAAIVEDSVAAKRLRSSFAAVAGAVPGDGAGVVPGDGAGAVPGGGAAAREDGVSEALPAEGADPAASFGSGCSGACCSGACCSSDRADSRASRAPVGGSASSVPAVSDVPSSPSSAPTRRAISDSRVITSVSCTDRAMRIIRTMPVSSCTLGSALDLIDCSIRVASCDSLSRSSVSNRPTCSR